MSASPHMTINRLRVQNYRSLVDIDISLASLTILVGKNGVGKSSVIDVLRFVRDIFTYGFDIAVLKRGGLRALRSWFADDMAEVSILLYFAGPEWSGEYGFAFGANAANKEECEIRWEQLSLVSTNGTQEPIILEAVDGKFTKFPQGMEGIKVEDLNRISYRFSRHKTKLFLSQLAMTSDRINNLRQFLSKMNFYDISPDNLRIPQEVSAPFPLMETGENLASALKEFKQNKEDAAITDPLSKVLDGLKGYSVEMAGGFLVTKLHYYMTRDGGLREVFADLLNESDGTLRMLSIFAMLHQTRFPATLALEEPEKGVHPGALGVLCHSLRDASATCQILLSTHSPEFIAFFPADMLRVVGKVYGETKISPAGRVPHRVITENLLAPGALARARGTATLPGNTGNLDRG